MAIRWKTVQLSASSSSCLSFISLTFFKAILKLTCYLKIWLYRKTVSSCHNSKLSDGFCQRRTFRGKLSFFFYFFSYLFIYCLFCVWSILLCWLMFDFEIIGCFEVQYSGNEVFYIILLDELLARSLCYLTTLRVALDVKAALFQLLNNISIQGLQYSYGRKTSWVTAI